MTSSETPEVDVVLNSEDRQALASALSDPKRPAGRLAYGYVRLLLWVVLVMLALLHPIVWIAVALGAVVEYLERRTRKAAGELVPLNS